MENFLNIDTHTHTYTHCSAGYLNFNFVVVDLLAHGEKNPNGICIGIHMILLFSWAHRMFLDDVVPQAAYS